QPEERREAETLDDPATHLEDLAGERDRDRADRGAGVARDAERLRAGRGVEPVVERGVDEPDGPRIDEPEDLAADHLVRRADARAGRAAEAAEGVDESPRPRAPPPPRARARCRRRRCAAHDPASRAP